MICPGLGHYVDRNSSGVLYSNATKMENAGIYLCEAEFRETYEKQSIFAILVVFGKYWIMTIISSGVSLAYVVGPTYM